MKKYLFSITIFLLGVVFISANPTENVYLCNSSGAAVYHSIKNCKGLTKCSHGIITVSKSEAVSKYKRRACKLCY